MHKVQKCETFNMYILCDLYLPGEARPCSDKNDKCSSWAGQGECDSNPSWMIPNCQKSCDRCDCINTHVSI